MRYIAVSILLFFYFNLSGQTGSFYSSRWHTGKNEKDPVYADDYTFHKKSKIYYILSNDYTKVYITLKVEEKEVWNRILKEGLTVWINMDNKPEKNMGVRFPLGSENIEKRSVQSFPEKNIDADEELTEALSHANTIELIGFRNEPDKRFPSENNDNFAGTIKINENGVLHYRLILPVEKIPVRNSRNGNGAMPFTIGVEYGNIASRNETGKKDKNSMTAVTVSTSGYKPIIMWIKNVKLAEEK